MDAARGGHLPVVKELVKVGADVMVQNKVLCRRVSMMYGKPVYRKKDGVSAYQVDIWISSI